MKKRPDVDGGGGHSSSYGVELAEERAVLTEGQSPVRVSAADGLDLAAEIANLVPRDSELHESRVDLDAEELDRAGRDRLDLVGMHGEAEVVESLDEQLRVTETLLVAARKHQHVVYVND